MLANNPSGEKRTCFAKENTPACREELPRDSTAASLDTTDDAHHRRQNGILLSWHMVRGDRIQHPLGMRLMHKLAGGVPL